MIAPSILIEPGSARLLLALFATSFAPSSLSFAQEVDVKGGFFDRSEVGSSIVGERPSDQNPAHPTSTPAPEVVSTPNAAAPAGSPAPDSFDRTEANAREKREKPVGNAFGARSTPVKPRPKEGAPTESNPRPIEEPKDLQQVNPKDALQMMDRLRGVIDQARTTKSDSTSQEGASRFLKREIKGESPLTTSNVNTETPDKAPLVGYVDRPVLSLFVSGLPEYHLVQSLRSLRRLREQYDVQIGEILIFGGTERLDSLPLSNDSAQKSVTPKKPRSKWTKKLTPEAGTLLASLGKLSVDHPFEYEDILAKYDIDTSPAWIVRVEDTDYVFEGDFDPAELFDSAGKFIVPRK
ncbi:MAG: hypothetical protein IT290_09830 [Deltaproteobacteria bacterium]|nr:hypothetical protein [Deltaproteobacteria bacterium]